MKTKLLVIALLASAALIAPVQGGNHRSNSGGNYVRSSGGSSARSGGGPSFRSAPMHNFSGSGRMIYSSQRFSSVGVRSSRSTDFHPHYVNSNVSSSIGSRQFKPVNVNRGNNVARFSNVNRGTVNPSQVGNSSRLARNGNSTE